MIKNFPQRKTPGSNDFTDKFAKLPKKRSFLEKKETRNRGNILQLIPRASITEDQTILYEMRPSLVSLKTQMQKFQNMNLKGSRTNILTP